MQNFFLFYLKSAHLPYTQMSDICTLLLLRTLTNFKVSFLLRLSLKLSKSKNAYTWKMKLKQCLSIINTSHAKQSLNYPIPKWILCLMKPWPPKGCKLMNLFMRGCQISAICPPKGANYQGQSQSISFWMFVKISIFFVTLFSYEYFLIFESLNKHSNVSIVILNCMLKPWT